MFNYKKVINATTGARYYIAAARLAADEYDWSATGGNAFTVDLQPLSEEGRPLCDLTLSVSNCGPYVMLTKNLDKYGSTHEVYSEELGMPVLHEDMQDCIVEGDLLIVTTGGEDA